MEIEIRAFIPSIRAMKNKIKSIGARYVDEERIIDHWFCEKSKKRFEDVAMNKVGSYGLRIREIHDNKTAYQLCCKVIRTEGDHNAFKEFETNVESFKQTKKILESIGFKEFCVLDKKRIIFKKGNVSINIENIKGFKPAIELEIIASRNEKRHKERLREIMKALGIEEKQIIKKSITHLYMKENSFK